MKHSLLTSKALIPQERIERKIYLIRGNKVMIDHDLAELYGVETRVLNQAVRRNQMRFPDDFMFCLTRREIRNLSQIVISSRIKHSPNVFAFTEQGVAMLSSVLNSHRAIHVNIQIISVSDLTTFTVPSQTELDFPSISTLPFDPERPVVSGIEPSRRTPGSQPL